MKGSSRYATDNVFLMSEIILVNREGCDDTFSVTRPDCLKIDFPTFCELKTIFRLKIK